MKRPHRLICVMPNNATLMHLSLESHGLTFCGFEIGRFPIYEALFEDSVFEPTCLVCIAEEPRR